MESWQIIVSSLGGSVVLNVALAFLFREWISTRIRKSIEHEYTIKEKRLEAELQGKLEGIKAGYQIVAQESQVRFSRLHAEQAEILKTLHSYLVEYSDILQCYKYEIKDNYENDKAKQLMARFMEVCKRSTELAKKNSILLPRSLYLEVHEFFALAYAGQVSKMVIARGGDKNEDHTPLIPIIDYLEGANKVLISLEDEFRRILGTIPARSSLSSVPHVEKDNQNK